MRKLIINYEDDISTDTAINLVKSVIEMGRISKQEKCFCSLSLFKNKLMVLADISAKGTDTFKIVKE